MKTINYNDKECARRQMNGRRIYAEKSDYSSEDQFQAAFEGWKRERGPDVEIVTIIGDLDDDEIKCCIIGPKTNYNEEPDSADEYIFM